jgi:nucleoid DNA-binding protein
MTKVEILEIVAQRMKQNGNRISKEYLKEIVECVLDAFMDQLAKQKRIEIRGFGVFHLKKTPARVGRNPITGEEAKVPAHMIVQFKPGSRMKQAVDGG